MKIIIFLCIIALPFFNVQAGEFFDYRLSKNYAFNGETIKVFFNYKLEGYNQGDFLVRPVLPRGKVEIFDREKNSWILADSLWSDLPSLSEEMEIRFHLEGEGRLHFLVQNTSDAAIYQTPEQVIWGGNLLAGYTQKVNQGVFRYKIEQDTNSDAPNISSGTSPPQNHEGVTIKGTGFIDKVIKYFNEIF